MRSKILGVLLSFVLGTAQAATLDFTSATCNGGVACTAGAIIDQSHGDIAGQLDVSYRSSTSPGNGSTFENFLRFWDSGYAGLTNVLWGSFQNSGYVGEIRLIPTAGNKVSLSALQLGSWGSGLTSQVTIFDGSYNVLASSGSIPVGGTPASLLYTLSSTNGLIIQWGPDSNNVAIDNIAFAVAASPAPEPETYLLLLAGLGAIAWRVRSRSAAAKA